MIPSRIQKALSKMPTHRIPAPPMATQASVFDAAAEFSRNTNLLILTDPANLTRLKAALQHLQAEREEDRTYWKPLKAELERLRHAARRNRQTDQNMP